MAAAAADKKEDGSDDTDDAPAMRRVRTQEAADDDSVAGGGDGSGGGSCAFVAKVANTVCSLCNRMFNHALSSENLKAHQNGNKCKAAVEKQRSGSAAAGGAAGSVAASSYADKWAPSSPLIILL